MRTAIALAVLATLARCVVAQEEPDETEAEAGEGTEPKRTPEQISQALVALKDNVTALTVDINNWNGEPKDGFPLLCRMVELRGDVEHGSDIDDKALQDLEDSLNNSTEKFKPTPERQSLMTRLLSAAADQSVAINSDNPPAGTIDALCKVKSELSTVLDGAQEVTLKQIMEGVSDVLAQHEERFSVDLVRRSAEAIGMPSEKVKGLVDEIREMDGKPLESLNHQVKEVIDLDALLRTKGLTLEAIRSLLKTQTVSPSKVKQLILTAMDEMSTFAPVLPDAKKEKREPGGATAQQATPAEIENITRYARLAAAAYEAECNSPPDNYTLVEPIANPETDTDGFIAKNEAAKELVLVLRGTKSVIDINTDLTFSLVDYKSPGVSDCAGCKVHKGFLAAWNSVADKALATLQKELIANPGMNVTVVGHSLGGALASLGGMSIIGSGIPASIYTFGQPRTGDRAYADFVDTKAPGLVRVTHNDDGVPQVPFTTWGYQHHSTEFNQPTDNATEVLRCVSQEPQDCNNERGKATFGLNKAHMVYMGLEFGAFPGSPPLCGASPEGQNQTKPQDATPSPTGVQEKPEQTPAGKPGRPASEDAPIVFPETGKPGRPASEDAPVKFPDSGKPGKLASQDAPVVFPDFDEAANAASESEDDFFFHPPPDIVPDDPFTNRQ